MRYKLEFKPQGIIPKGVDLEIPLVPIPEPGTAAGEIIRIGFCETSVVTAWLVELAENSIHAYPGIKYAVASGLDGLIQPVPFPDSCFSGHIIMAMGCLVEGDCLEWVATPSDVAVTVLLFPYTGSDAPFGERCDGTSFLAFSTDPSYDYTAFTLEIQATLNGDPIGPLITCYCDPTRFVTAWGGWGGFHVANSGFPCSPSVTPGADFTIAEFAVGTCHIDVTTAGSGNVFARRQDAVTWTVTQLTGTTQALTFVPGLCGHWLFYQDAGPSYAGTSYQLDATLDATPFGDPLIITCEV